MNTQTEPVKIVGFRQEFEQALISAQKNALAHAEALEREIAEKGLDAVVKRLKKESLESE